ncbi:MAG: hypothetical protein H0V36_09175, partial [Chloroflexi bacterium]|nr:hypothetical protein [Chloroflexota bacterium]
PTHDENAEDQQLFQGLRQALRSDGPIELLSMMSGFVAVTDPRARDPFARDVQAPDLGDLVESFVGAPYAETTAALMVIRALVTDELMQARISRELAQRRQPMPDWLVGLARSQIEPEVWFLTHVLGDGDDYLIGVSLPSGHSLSVLVYVDHNLGTVVKDAFVVPEPLEDFALKVGTTIDDPDQTLTRTDPATARAAIEAAIEHGSRFYPPLSTDSWPMCRPLVEWILRQLPPGAVAPERKEWSTEETAAIATDFFASRFGAALDHEEERSLLETVLWFGTDYATGDPFRWSPVTVELLLDDWFPRKVVAEPAYLSKLPDLVRAFIRYCHDRLGIRAALTAETLAAVDHYEPGYQRAIRSARPQGPAALLAQIFDGEDGGGGEGDLSTGDILLEGLDRKVGGRMQLMNLDDYPLPDEPFEWAAIPDDVRPVVREVLDVCDRCAAELLDTEHRTAMRRFLSRAAVADPAIFRRKASPVRAAAAVAWVVCRANDTVGAYWSGLSVQDLLAWFGVKGSVAQRAEPFLRANGVDPHRLYGTMDLETSDLLTSKRRASIIKSRDRWMDA